MAILCHMAPAAPSEKINVTWAFLQLPKQKNELKGARLKFCKHNTISPNPIGNIDAHKCKSWISPVSDRTYLNILMNSPEKDDSSGHMPT